MFRCIFVSVITINKPQIFEADRNSPLPQKGNRSGSTNSPVPSSAPSNKNPHRQLLNDLIQLESDFLTSGQASLITLPDEKSMYSNRNYNPNGGKIGHHKKSSQRKRRYYARGLVVFDRHVHMVNVVILFHFLFNLLLYYYVIVLLYYCRILLCYQLLLWNSTPLTTLLKNNL